MLPKQIEEKDVTYYELRARGGHFIIRRLDKSHWFLKYQGDRGGINLCHDLSVVPKKFATPDDVLDYCRQVTEADPDWAEFRKWVGEAAFPTDLGDASVWSWGADIFP